VSKDEQLLLADAQTSGGLLMALPRTGPERSWPALERHAGAGGRDRRRDRRGSRGRMTVVRGN
jgi:hypothetical protein